MSPLLIWEAEGLFFEPSLLQEEKILLAESLYESYPTGPCGRSWTDRASPAALSGFE